MPLLRQMLVALYRERDRIAHETMDYEDRWNNLAFIVTPDHYRDMLQAADHYSGPELHQHDSFHGAKVYRVMNGILDRPWRVIELAP